jgi:lipopolysaccharide biosynthesis glycosyltransferase
MIIAWFSILFFIPFLFFSRFSFLSHPNLAVVITPFLSPSTSIAICYDVTNDYIPSAFVTIFSILRVFTKSPYRLSFYIFVTNLILSDRITHQLSCLRNLANLVNIQLLNFNENIANDLKSVWKSSIHDPSLPFTVQYRLYYTEIVSESFILVMDTDVYAGLNFLRSSMPI